MTGAHSQRGAAPVGFVTELGPVEAGAVQYLRLWSDGPMSRFQMRNDFATALGTERGEKALNSFATLCELIVRYGRRPLVRHDTSCRCLGADESCFANLIGCASEGEREDALLIATTIMRPDMAGPVVGLAEEFGLVLRRMAIGAERRTELTATLH